MIDLDFLKHVRKETVAHLTILLFMFSSKAFSIVLGTYLVLTQCLLNEGMSGVEIVSFRIGTI